MAVLGFVASLLVHRWLVPHFSGDADEAVYVLQAKMLESGRITLSARDHGLFFRPWLTGVHDGRIFTQYLPSWPAALALSDSVFGTMVIAPAAMVSVWIVGTYAMAKELLGERRTALLAAALVLFCPLVLLHGSLYLSYVFSAALLTGGAALLLHGYRVSSRLELVLAGGAFGLVLLARPFDVFLFGFPVAVYLGGRHWRERSKLARAAGSGLLGFGPFVVVLLAYDTRVTGSALRLPIPASDPLNTFGLRPAAHAPRPTTRPLHLRDGDGSDAGQRLRTRQLAPGRGPARRPRAGRLPATRAAT
ncbi:MAG TPA: glycosyltransferase family 39 protein [Acidimicrobiales bacterium]